MKQLSLPYNSAESTRLICSFAVIVGQVMSFIHVNSNPRQRGQTRSQLRERCVRLKWGLLSSHIKAPLLWWFCPKLLWRLSVSPPAVSTAHPDDTRYDSRLPAAPMSSVKAETSHSWPRTADIGGLWRNGLHNVMSCSQRAGRRAGSQITYTAFCSLVSLWGEGSGGVCLCSGVCSGFSFCCWVKPLKKLLQMTLDW